jgi:hypothetical protein
MEKNQNRGNENTTKPINIQEEGRATNIIKITTKPQ